MAMRFDISDMEPAIRETRPSPSRVASPLVSTHMKTPLAVFIRYSLSKCSNPLSI